MKYVTTDPLKPKVLAPGMYAIDVEPIPPRNRNNMEVHLDYPKHLKESVDTLREIVEEARVEKPLDRSLASAAFTLNNLRNLKGATAASGSKPRRNTKKDRTLPAKSDKKKVKDHPKINKSSVKRMNHVDSSISYKLPVKQPKNFSTSEIVITERLSNTSQKPLTRYRRKNKQEKAISIDTPIIAVTQSIDDSVVQIILWYLDSGCLKHMTGNRSRLRIFVKKFIRAVRFRNDHFGAIMGNGDYVIGDSVISRDGTNLYTISVEDMMKSSPICLLSKASKNKSWLWHRRLNHINFGTINDLARKDRVRGLPRLKFKKDHLCSACQLGKSQKYSHKPQSENTNLKVLNTLHMDLCGPMRVQTINGKKYILIIVDDYSRFTWVKFLRSKDETPEFVIKFLKQIQVGLNKTVRYIQTDNGTKFVNQVLTEYYESVGIFHQKSVLRTPQQNGVVERRNRTLMEAARTMLIFSKAPMFLWAEAVATACYT
ncbi:retrovirus-related pol polyprotein from transposon TNT 1-94 [Tanacetum coccineum]